MPVVYKATNKINGNFYIGLTRFSVEKRRKQHYSMARSQLYIRRGFSAAIAKHGESAFSWEIIEHHEDYEVAKQAEIRLIAELKPRYNRTRGGDGVIGIERDEQWCKRMGDANRGRKRTAEQRARMRANGKPEVHFRPVTCLESGEVFPSLKAAAERTGASASMIGDVCGGIWIAAKGLHFVFGSDQLSVDKRNELIARAEMRRTAAWKKIRACRMRAVICINTGQSFESGAAASRAIGLSVMRISQICRGQGVTKDGLRFMFADADAPPISKRKSAAELVEIRKRQNAGYLKANEATRKRVICLDDGTEYDSITDCAIAISRCVQSVSAAIWRNGRSAGRRFAFVEN